MNYRSMHKKIILYNIFFVLLFLISTSVLLPFPDPGSVTVFVLFYMYLYKSLRCLTIGLNIMYFVKTQTKWQRYYIGLLYISCLLSISNSKDLIICILFMVPCLAVIYFVRKGSKQGKKVKSMIISTNLLLLLCAIIFLLKSGPTCLILLLGALPFIFSGEPDLKKINTGIVTLLHVVLLGVVFITLPNVISAGFFTTGIIFLYAYVYSIYSQNRKQIYTMLGTYTGLEEDKIYYYLQNAAVLLASSFIEHSPQTEADLTKWYKKSAFLYLFDLTNFYYEIMTIVHIFLIIRYAKGKILDFGGGAGYLALALGNYNKNIYYFDVGQEGRKYLEFMMKRFEVRDITLINSIEEEKNFDTIICMDVLEHVKQPLQILEILVSKLQSKGRIIINAPFGKTAEHPMHLDHDLDIDEYFLKQGFQRIKNKKYLKVYERK